MKDLEFGTVKIHLDELMKNEIFLSINYLFGLKCKEHN